MLLHRLGTTALKIHFPKQKRENLKRKLQFKDISHLFVLSTITIIKTIKWEVHNFYLVQKFVNLILMGVYEVTFFDLKPQSRLYEFLVQIKVMDFSFDCLYSYCGNPFPSTRFLKIMIELLEVMLSVLKWKSWKRL